MWNDWRSALLLVKPETVIAWHRKGFRLYWRWKSRRCQGRPTVSLEVRNLIRHMSLANPRWGAPRIHGELLKLGIQVRGLLNSPFLQSNLVPFGRTIERPSIRVGPIFVISNDCSSVTRFVKL